MEMSGSGALTDIPMRPPMSALRGNANIVVTDCNVAE